jgi:hypothetical protein
VPAEHRGDLSLKPSITEYEASVDGAADTLEEAFARTVGNQFERGRLALFL